MPTSPTLRLLRLAARLRTPGRRYSVKELADHFGVSKPTMQRDIDKLSLIYPVVEESGARNTVFYRMDGDAEALPELSLSREEGWLLHAAVTALRAQSPAGMSGSLAALSGKLASIMGTEGESLASELASVFTSQQRGFVEDGQDDAVLRTLIAAITDKKRVVVDYQPMNADGPKTRTVRPLRLIWHRQALYLALAPDGMDDVRTYAVHRIRSAKALDSSFDDTGLQDLVDEKLSGAFGIFSGGEPENVVIRFDPFIAKTILERTYHPGESKETQDDGSVLYRVTTSSQWEVTPWVLSFGPWAELLEPEAWREAIGERARALGALYEEG